jgi:hypothetical protein
VFGDECGLGRYLAWREQRTALSTDGKRQLCEDKQMFDDDWLSGETRIFQGID